MLRLLAQAHRYRAMRLEAQGRTMFDLAREAGVGRPYFCRIVKFGFLAPDVVKAMLRNRQLSPPAGPLQTIARWNAVHTTPISWVGVLVLLDGLLVLQSRRGRDLPAFHGRLFANARSALFYAFWRNRSSGKSATCGS